MRKLLSLFLAALLVISLSAAVFAASEEPIITLQPQSPNYPEYSVAIYTVKATGTELKDQWQYRTSSSGSWKNVSAASGKTANYSLTTAARHNGYQYRCKITDSAGNVIYTSIVKLTVKK